MQAFKHIADFKEKILIFLLLASVCLTGGCAKYTTASVEDGYATDAAMSALEYSLLLTKELSVAENVLSTRSIMATSVINGSYEAAKEAQNTEESITTIREAQDVIITTMPAQTYESDRQSAMDLLEDAIIALSGYKGALEAGDSYSIQAYADEIKACFVAISAEANHEYE